MAVVGGGAQAEFCVVHECLAMRVPADVPWLNAGAFPEAFTTAHDALFTQCGLGVGERLSFTAVLEASLPLLVQGTTASRLPPSELRQQSLCPRARERDGRRFD